jgi:4-diphosphocytidyl-2-C-methyl-D-erythritol kinase
MSLELLAPAKLNLTLEITGRRPDGYHDIVSLMQTIDLCDRVRLDEAQVIELSIDGDELRGVPREGPRNLAFAAAQALASAAGDASLGAHIELDKHIPAGMGLGGGSTDAAAVLRGLNRLWGLGLTNDELGEVGASVGSDVAFFVHAGSCLVSGRGDQVEALPDGEDMPLTLFLPEVDLEDKTRRMYGRIESADYSDGRRGRVAAESVRRGLPLASTDLVNAFDPHVRAAVPAVAGAMALCREEGLAVMACGSGPGFYTVARYDTLPPLLARELERDWGVRTLASRTLRRLEALAVREV